MIAGLPGTGIGLVFFVVSALLSPIVELVALARGRSSRERWRTVSGLVLTAALVVVGITTMTAILFFASRLIASEGLSPFWRRVSDSLVMVLLAIWAASVMVVFFGLDFVRQKDHRPTAARPATAVPRHDTEASRPLALPTEAMTASQPVP